MIGDHKKGDNITLNYSLVGIITVVYYLVFMRKPALLTRNLAIRRHIHIYTIMSLELQMYLTEKWS